MNKIKRVDNCKDKQIERMLALFAATVTTRTPTTQPAMIGQGAKGMECTISPRGGSVEMNPIAKAGYTILEQIPNFKRYSAVSPSTGTTTRPITSQNITQFAYNKNKQPHIPDNNITIKCGRYTGTLYITC
jgi:hypothetical protein